MPKELVTSDGSFDFSRGVNSDAVPTVQSDLVPHGLRRDQLSWLSNGTVRGGNISPRNGWNKLLDLINSGLWQGGYMYEPIPDGNPYLVCSISGRIYKVFLDGKGGSDLGGSAAQSVILMIIVVILTAIQFRYVEKKVHY